MNNALNNLGIRPRNIWAYRALYLRALLHGNRRHLISNIFPLIILSWLIAARDRSEMDCG
jgi:hypothetical protein